MSDTICPQKPRRGRPQAPEAAPEAAHDQPTMPDWARDLPPEVQAPLAPFDGAEPPAPPWFAKAVARTPERSMVRSGDIDIELLTWGEIGKPGLLFIHGGSAHADWWSFIAPFFADDYRVAAMSLAGMGGSGWRQSYSDTDYAIDAEACARAAGLYEGGRKPIYIGHSFGGAITYYAALGMPHQMHAAVLLDAGFGGPPPIAGKAKRFGPAAEMRAMPSLDKTARVYPTLAAALARFRLMPPQGTRNLYIADFIARRSLKPAPMPDGSGQGWSWRFDPHLWRKVVARETPKADGPLPQVPIVHIRGEHSVIVQFGESPVLRRLTNLVIPDAEHHLMIDQPLALVAALRSLLAVWPA